MENLMTSEKEKKEPLRLLIVDDEEAARYGMRRALLDHAGTIDDASSIGDAREKIAALSPDLILLDVNLPDGTGLDFLRELGEAGEEMPPVILITAYGSERMAVEAIKAGAYDYLSKPFEVDDLRLVVKNALETVRLRRENQTLRTRIEREAAQHGALLGNSVAMQRERSLIEKVAETDATVLVRGESGTGKELVARELHERSTSRRHALPRRDRRHERQCAGEAAARARRAEDRAARRQRVHPGGRAHRERDPP